MTERRDKRNKVTTVIAQLSAWKGGVSKWNMVALLSQRDKARAQGS